MSYTGGIFIGGGGGGDFQNPGFFEPDPEGENPEGGDTEGGNTEPQTTPPQNNTPTPQIPPDGLRGSYFWDSKKIIDKAIAKEKKKKKL